MIDVIQITTTIGSLEEAQRIATALVEQRLAACVQISGPVTSVYRWQGKLEQSAEWVCVVKTRQTLYDRAAAAIRQVHSYETPEIIATPIVLLGADYLAWLAAQTAAE